MRYFPDEPGPIAAKRYAQMQREVCRTAACTVQRLRQYRLDVAYGVAGTIEALGNIAAFQTHQRALQPGDILTYPQLRHIIDLLCSLPLEERKQVPGLNPDRADIIIGGAAILDTLLGELAIDTIRPSRQGLRQGLIADYLARTAPGNERA
jgi:exopolyphosphatase/guanosine-5'-triphosphate,3'-diphosphate pyrophosphatase